MNPYRKQIQVPITNYNWRSFSSHLRKRKRQFLLWLGNIFWREPKCPWCPKRGCTWAQQYFCQLAYEKFRNSKSCQK